MTISVIIPIGPVEDTSPSGPCGQLLANFAAIPVDQQPQEIIICIAPAVNYELPTSLSLKSTTKIVRSTVAARYAQLNYGASLARADHLVFMHADSRLTPDAWEAMLEALGGNQRKLYFFRFAFDISKTSAQIKNGHGWFRAKFAKFIEWGVWLRTQTWGMPYGDQGFGIRTNIFWELSGFPALKVGEDHAFAWACKNAGVELTRINAALYTSPRKYDERGWLITALKHNLLGIQQSLPYLTLFKVPLKILRGCTDKRRGDRCHERPNVDNGL